MVVNSISIIWFDNLTVSLEWQPGALDSLPLAGCPASGVATSYLADLKAGLQQTAAYLYYYSEGQLALGHITIYTDGANWADADLRVLASSSYRPAAFVGGIVKTPTPNISATNGLTGTVFYRRRSSSAAGGTGAARAAAAGRSRPAGGRSATSGRTTRWAMGRRGCGCR
jgi:hypothetical protein